LFSSSEWRQPVQGVSHSGIMYNSRVQKNTLCPRIGRKIAGSDLDGDLHSC